MAKLFFSYSHKDEELRNELEVHLAMLQRQGLITAWHDRRIGAGKDIYSEISTELESADIVLLLVSAHFLASDYCYDKEMARALKLHEEGDVKVIPVIMHPCDWHSAPFGNLRATPLDGKPVSMFANQNEALLQVTKDIRAAVAEMGFTPEEMVGQGPVSSNSGISAAALRSSNLRVKKKFNDHEVDNFLDESFEYIARYFEASLAELQGRNRNITTKYRKIDANCFTASIYDDGAKASECTVWTGSETSFVGGIGYFSGITTSRNQYSESLTIENDGYSLHLKPWGMSHLVRGEKPDSLTHEGAAEYYWSMLIGPLQQ